MVFSAEMKQNTSMLFLGMVCARADSAREAWGTVPWGQELGAVMLSSKPLLHSRLQAQVVLGTGAVSAPVTL